MPSGIYKVCDEWAENIYINKCSHGSLIQHYVDADDKGNHKDFMDDAIKVWNTDNSRGEIK